MDNKTEQIFIINTSEPQGLIGPQNSTETTQANLQNVLATNVCRTCAAATEFVIPIFHGEGLQNNLAEKIHKHLPIQVSEHDELPQVLCYQCASTLLAWHELVQCCVQADRALRTNSGLTQNAQPGTSTEVTELQTQLQQEEEKNKNEFVELVAPAPLPMAPPPPPEHLQPLDPPQPPEHLQALDPPQPQQLSCGYCGQALADRAAHTAHLVAAHAELLFHCDECGQYVDRKDLILHMTMHALHYSLNDKHNENDKDIQPLKCLVDKPETPKKQKKAKKKTAPSEDSAKDSKENHRELMQKDDVNKELIGNRNGSKEASEFSDHTDTEDGFGPLPESVFEAIEDSQDSQEAPSEAKAKKDSKSKKKWARACPHCPKVYTAPSSYFYHIRYSHKGIKEHACDICQRKFATKASVRQHMLTHDAALAHECGECGKRFRSNASLYIHRQTHGTEKRFVCQTCGARFRWRQLLVRHEQRHAAPRPHACPTCGRAFRVRCDMLRHARTHHHGAHACLACGRHFAQLRYLKVHMDKKHAAKEQALPPAPYVQSSLGAPATGLPSMGKAVPPQGSLTPLVPVSTPLAASTPPS